LCLNVDASRNSCPEAFLLSSPGFRDERNADPAANYKFQKRPIDHKPG